jgi:hypothetical protein
MNGLRTALAVICVVLLVCLLSSCGGGGNSVAGGGGIDTNLSGMNAALVGPLAGYLPPSGTIVTFNLLSGFDDDKVYKYVSYAASSMTVDCVDYSVTRKVFKFAKSGSQTNMTGVSTLGWDGWDTDTYDGFQVGMFGTPGTTATKLYTRSYTDYEGPHTTHGRMIFKVAPTRQITVAAGTYSCVGFVVYMTAEMVSPSAARAVEKVLGPGTGKQALTCATVWMASRKGIIAIDAGDTTQLTTASWVISKLPHLVAAKSIMEPPPSR